MKKIIGITGGIGSGKSTVAEIIEEFGYPVYYSDNLAKEIVNNDAELQLKIRALLGDEAYDASGRYDRAFVAQKVFDNVNQLNQLNSLIHPAVKKDFERWVEDQDETFLFKETALLFELKLHEACDRSILVTADDEIRIRRVMERDNKTTGQVQAIINRQMPENEKAAMADFVIFNNEGFAELRNATNLVLKQLVASFDQENS
ncbi:dephospho-CoA kinase [Kaistella pullorum]|uniref:Dephospho-CoA kinase n=1 Tax=Kaistella pullorum TaxID=2763074 RepID=A0ABR8WJA0_9FLAO|nr:dephospho-CoA kinase [Kaistella pullorum]MBD8016963.1 dephospho-CoA kinase [Kaistella pullorum]